jgi:hypothetical protein
MRHENELAVCFRQLIFNAFISYDMAATLA